MESGDREFEKQLKYLYLLLRHFTFDQLRETIFPLITVVSWKEVRRTIIKTRDPINKDSVIKALMIKLKRYLPRDVNSINSFIQLIHLYDVCLHQRSMWITYTMTQDAGREPMYFLTMDIDDNIETHFANMRRNVLMTRLLRFSDTEDCSLSGFDIRNLYQLLKNREASATCGADVLHLASLRAGNPDKSSTGIDFSQIKDKKTYLSHCFTEKPSFKDYTVVNEPQPWNVEDIVAGMDKITFGKAEISFRSPDLLQMFKEMSLNGIFTTPLPSYVADIQKSGKNLIYLEKRE